MPSNYARDLMIMPRIYGSKREGNKQIIFLFISNVTLDMILYR